MSAPTEGYVRGVWKRLTETERVLSFGSNVGYALSVYPKSPLRAPLPSEACRYCGGARGTKRTCEGCGAS